VNIKNKNKFTASSVTIITVNYNNCLGLEKTINSVIQQDYDNYQYLIVDGASEDGSVELINSFNNNEFNKIIEKDEGIYHAMNKAIGIANSEWILFMNSGDIFLDSSSLSSIMEKASSDIDVIYSDWFYLASSKRVNADKIKMNVRHQSIVYRRSLHDVYGVYVVAPNITISDYIFFSSISGKRWTYHEVPLTICDESGVSANVSHFYQRISVDLLFGRRSRFSSIGIFIIYPMYKFFKIRYLRIVKYIRTKL